MDEPEVELEPKVELESEVQIEPEVEIESKVELEPKVDLEPNVEDKVELESKVQIELVVELESKVQIEPEVELVVELESETEDNSELEVILESTKLEPEISVNTDKPAYLPGEQILISGLVSNFDENNSKIVTIIVTNLEGEIILCVFVTLEEDGSFSKKFIVTNPLGEYQVTAQFETKEAWATFELCGNTVSTLEFEAIPEEELKVTTIFTSFESSSRSFEFNSLELSLECKDGNCLNEIEIRIPSWIKENIKYWSQENSDAYLVEGIKYMMIKGIIVSPQNSDNSSEQSFPDWLKINAGWWANEQIDDDTFVEGIQFLINERIIKIPQTTQG